MRPFPRWLLWTSSLLTGATGLVYMYMKYMLEPMDTWAVINHPWQPAVLKLHIVVAPVMVFAVGLIWMDHVWRHFRQGVRAGRRSGVVAMAVLAPMVFTGYLIQAVTHVGWLQALAWTHIATGTIYLLGLAAHARVFRGLRGARGRNAIDDGGGVRLPEGEARPRVATPVERNRRPPARPRPVRPSADTVSARGRRTARPRGDHP
jgi:hypothetical protein